MNEIDRPYNKVSMLFPLLNGEEYDALKADIAKNGLLEPIWLHPDGSIIDGRNRHRACIETNTPPRFRTWDNGSSLVGFVVSLNLHRRHLTSSQTAMIAQGVLPMLEEEAAARIREAARTEWGGNISTPLEQQGKSRDQAAALFNTNPRYVSDAKKIQDAAPDLAEEVRAGNMSIPKAKQELAERSGVEHPPQLADHQRLNASTCNEWYTPAPYIEAARRAMGGIDLDPASCELANKTICARLYFSKGDDGLSHPWGGRVWLNPPYGYHDSGESNQAVWSARLIAEYKAGRTEQACLLVNAVPGNRWFSPLWEFPICFPDHRIRFYNEETEAGQPTHSNAIVYMGPNIREFVAAFSQFGTVARRITVDEF